MSGARPVAVVTGGRQGIGRGIALALAAAGFDIAVVDRCDDETTAHTLAEIEAHGAGALFLKCDLADLDAHDALVSDISAWRGSVDCLINNAAVAAPRRGDMLHLDRAAFDAVMYVNLRGTFFLSQKVAAWMARHPSARARSLVFISSVSAEMVSIERAEYCISKASASMMAKLFAVRLAPEGIGVFEIRPGIVRTAMTAGMAESYSVRIEDGLVPAGRWGDPSDIGRIVVPLANGSHGFATGSVIHAYGALHINRL